MARYLCQMCNSIVTYGENYPNHPCFFYKNSDSVFTMPHLNESEILDRKVQEANVTPNLYDRSGKSFSVGKQRHSEEYEKINFLLQENNEQISFVNLTGKKFSSSSDEPANNVQNETFSAKIHCNENASFKTSTENLEPSYRYESGSSGDCQKISNFDGIQLPQKKCESNIPTLFHAASNEKYGQSLEEIKRQSFNNNKLFLLECLEDTSIKAYLDPEKISLIPNFPSSPYISPVSVQSAEDLIEVPWDRNHSIISHKMSSPVPSGSEDTIAKVTEPSNSLPETNAVAGPSGIRVDIVRNSETGQFHCNVCPKKFTFRSKFDAHNRKHTGEKPFVCDQCQKRFSQKQNLQTHALTHTGKKPYVCDLCGKEFATKQNLERHTLTHTGEKPFVCDVCKKRYTQESHLKRHARTHMDEKPYECRICGRAFRNLSSRIFHYKKEHE